MGVGVGGGGRVLEEVVVESLLVGRTLFLPCFEVILAARLVAFVVLVFLLLPLAILGTMSGIAERRKRETQGRSGY